jgi:hypothetical protein
MMNNREYCCQFNHGIVIEMTYGDAILLPAHLLPELDNIKFITGVGYSSKDIRYTSKRPKMELLSLDAIKPELPDPSIEKAKMEAAKQKLEEELKSLTAEIDSLS